MLKKFFAFTVTFSLLLTAQPKAHALFEDNPQARTHLINGGTFVSYCLTAAFINGRLGWLGINAKRFKLKPVTWATTALCSTGFVSGALGSIVYEVDKSAYENSIFREMMIDKLFHLLNAEDVKRGIRDLKGWIRFSGEIQEHLAGGVTMAEIADQYLKKPEQRAEFLRFYGQLKSQFDSGESPLKTPVTSGSPEAPAKVAPRHQKHAG